ncbi:hypothetical protein R6Q59_019403 [Mikania micrantha]
MMVAAVSETTTGNHSPLLKSDDVILSKSSIRPKSRQVSSRYLSPSPSVSPTSVSNSSSLRTLTPSRRAPSPLISRNSTTPVAKRSVSVDRRRPTRPDLTLKPNNACGELSSATKLLVTSTRSLSVSFQGEAFSLPVSKTKMTPQSPNLIRKRIPIRKIDCDVGDYGENNKPIDHQRWPGSIRQPNLSKSLSFDCDDDNININCKNVVRGLKIHQFVNLDSRRASFDGCKSNLDLGDSSNLIDLHNPDGNMVKDSYSDTDSVSSGSTSGIQENGSNRLRIGPGGIIVSPKFWQETNSRMRRLQDPSSPLSTSLGLKQNTPQKNFNSKRFSSDNCQLSSPKTMASPNKMRPSSPNKFMMTSSPSRGMISPRRNSVYGISDNSPSVLSFAVDVRRGKVGENRFFDAHVLRLLNNRQLQWRFVNAKNEYTVLKQTHSVEATRHVHVLECLPLNLELHQCICPQNLVPILENLWNAWITVSDLRDSVTKKRHRLQLLRQKLKLASMLKAQMVFLEDWAYLDNDHSLSLLGAIEALKASTLRLPVGAGATADLQSMKDAISSALDVMQSMRSSMNLLHLQVEEANLTVTEIAKVSEKERTLLRLCKDFLSVLSALKVRDCSLRTHKLQTRRVN